MERWIIGWIIEWIIMWIIGWIIGYMTKQAVLKRTMTPKNHQKTFDFSGEGWMDG